MTISVRPHLRSTSRRVTGGGVLLGAAIAVAACGSSGGSGAPASSPASSGSSSGASAGTAGSSSTAADTISVKNVSGVGNVLVDGSGKTLYLLTSEKGNKVSVCTTGNGCAKAWPEVMVPSGQQPKAGSGVQASLLGTTRDADGNTVVTYNHWVVYEYVGDSGAGSAKGQGLASFGGTWYTLGAAGNAVTDKAKPTSVQSSASAGTGGSGGYGY